MMSSAAFPYPPFTAYVSLHDAFPETPDLYASPPSPLGMGRQNGYLIAHRRPSFLTYGRRFCVSACVVCVCTPRDRSMQVQKVLEQALTLHSEVSPNFVSQDAV